MVTLKMVIAKHYVFLHSIHIRCYVDPNGHYTNNGNSRIIASYLEPKKSSSLRYIGTLEAH